MLKILLIGCFQFCNTQNDSTYYYFDKTTPINKLIEKTISSSKSNDENYFKLIYYSRLKETDSIFKYINELEKSKKLSKARLPKLLYFKGYYHKILDNDSLFLKYSSQAYQKALNQKDSLSVLYSLAALSQSYDYTNNYSYNLEYLNLLENTSKEYNNNYFKKIHKFLKGNYYLFRDNPEEASSNYNSLLKYNFSKKDSTYILYTYNNLGVLYETIIEYPDSAIFFYKKKIGFMNSSPLHASPEDYFNTFLNIGNSYSSKKELEKAKKYFFKADSVQVNGNQVFNKSLVEENFALLYEKSEDYKLAYSHLKNYNILRDSLKKEEQRIAVAKIKEEYDNEKLRATNLEIESKRKQNQNLLFGALVFILFGGITAFLIQKNTRKKQKLAEQEKVLETQKLATVLKEQELVSIDAMIEGQEKERQRIANDLHDDLGGLMATIKLHFNVLKDKQTPELFDNTTNLLDEAYQKIRSIAHTKNSGVIAKQGLLKAVQNMADKISVSNKISVTIIDHGLENRLENSLELTIFRIIQELITNVIKHAQATETTIHLTNHDDSLNIMIEDNGKGFNTSQITTKNKGMGISSIDKRIEHLNGNMTIESEINKGTNIIIDIPI